MAVQNRPKKGTSRHTIIKFDGSPCEEHGSLGCDCHHYQLQDEIHNLNIRTDNKILAIADLGLWRGRRVGYRVLDANVNSIFSLTSDYTHFYVDANNVRADLTHHDGTNYILFRELRGLPSTEKFLQSIYNGGKPSSQQISRYTKSIRPQVAEVYGW